MGNFNDAQLKAIHWKEGPLLVLGTPGSGKTTVIVNRVKDLIRSGVKPERILVITFTRAAADSMRQRFASLTGDQHPAVRMCTFHAFFFWIVKAAYGRQSLGVLDNSGRSTMLREILRNLNRDVYDNEDILRSVEQQLDRISCDMIDIKDYYSTDLPEQDFRAVYQTYHDRKTREGVLDFNDMVTQCYRLLKERPDILRLIRNMYPYIMVDEYQDTNRIQYEILKMIAAPRNNLFAVGDDDQSIYSFRGARPDIMLSFRQEFPGAEIITLSVNYRCPAVVTSFSSKLIGFNQKRYSKHLESAGKAGRIFFDQPKDVTGENQLLTGRIRNSLAKGRKPEEIAVLYRTNTQPRRLIYKLQENNIPFSVRDQVPDIFRHFAVRPVWDYICFALGDTKRSRFLNFMNKPVRYIRRDMLTSENVDLRNLLRMSSPKPYLSKNIRRLSAELRTISRLTPYTAVNYIRKAVGYETWLKEFAEKQNIDYDVLTDILDEFQNIASESETFGDFFQQKEAYEKMAEEQAGNRQENDRKGKIQLMTMHSAKGLEFEEVHIIDAVEQIIPHKKSRTPREIEEERRMFYVGITRASQNLYLYAPGSIRDREAEVSRFIREMSRDLTFREKKSGTGRSTENGRRRAE